MAIRGSRHSTSSHESDLSATVCNPSSTQSTPKESDFPPEPATRVSFSTSSSRSEEEHDVKDDLNNPVDGWPRVALLMAKTPDFAAFSRFRDLNVKNLLYYQAQLTRLRRKLHEQEYDDVRDRGEDDEVRKYANRADFLMTAEGSAQLKLVVEIRGLLKEYNEALLQYSQVSALPEPDTYNMKNFRKWLRHADNGNFSIGGEGEQHTWGDIYEDPDEEDFSPWKRFWKIIWTLIWTQAPPTSDLDLVVTRTPRKIDGFTRWVACYFIPFYEDFTRYREQKRTDKQIKQGTADMEKQPKGLKKRLSKRSSKKAKRVSPENWVPKAEKQETLATWSEKGMLRFTNSISTVVACLLPTIAITVLTQVHGTRNLLLCIAGFAVIFAVGLIFLTNGTSSRVEIFTATAAFSAVLVVFISVPVINVQGQATVGS
ncbi:hypothetical protein LHYA1_G003220 [Lachnellula hyalina]|uniref:DUF6594 domain-containing protein n=1 Tax=Lachnellula hyalina TaxID=1316788 RepID=A0A8H8TZ84_9HELO|nr:uncharacterized protein LHYA1_G003220 [Lachnellula hyalina]TVY27492.1 hypothetical protein LHYA1_G003220 [Lachnellula hyalina]